MRNLPEGYSASNSVLFCDNIYAPNVGIRQVTLPRFKGRYQVYEGLNRLNSIVALNRNKFDVFHPTYYNPYFLGKLKKPYVITVHDMIHEKFESWIKDRKTIELKRKSITNASKIIAISENTKKDVMDIYGIEENRFAVVHHGYSVDLSQSNYVDCLPEKYVLFVGVRAGYKNFRLFLEAFALINKLWKDVELVCTGSKFTEEELSLISKMGLTGKVKRFFVTDGQLTYLYQHALCFVYPSLYEGFGIPILEAFAAKCPIALSKTSCFPEIARDGGAYFDPSDCESMVKTIAKIIEDNDYKENLVKKGSVVLSDYSWTKMALQTVEVYKSLI
jgi:glycosyltransferase involved in cell wall biosynthesis